METILSVLNKTADFLQKNGVPNAKLDSQHLLAYGLGLKRMDLFLNFDRPLAEPELVKLRPIVARRAKREPLQHILGSVSFRGHEIKCDKRALIPRPETELILDILSELPPVKKILDIGTGTGCIAIATALELNASVVACDISKDALELAKENVAMHKLENKITLVHGDLFAGIGGKFDALLANLPYIPIGDKDSLQHEVLNGEPHVALFGGTDGLEQIRKLLNGCADYLNPNAPVILEIADGQEDVLQSEKFSGLKFIKARKDYNEQTRFAIFQISS